MTSYRVIQVAANGGLELSERPLSPPALGQVRLRVEACGICHTDSVAVAPHPATEPGRVPGHEAVGRIDALGEGVTGWAVGDRVGVGFLGGHCGVCTQCRRGRFVTCLDQPMTGVTVDGGYAEVLYARASGLVAIPDELPSQEAAPLLCAGFTVYNALLKSGAKPGEVVAIQGIGGLGHLGLQYARTLALRVVAIARGAEKEEDARSLGAQHYIDSAAQDVAAELAALGGAEVVVATASNGSFDAVLGGMSLGGRLVVVGASDEPVSVPPVALIFQGIEVLGSLTGTSIENEDNLAFAVAHHIRARIEPATLDDAPAAYHRMMSGAARYRMVLTV